MRARKSPSAQRLVSEIEAKIAIDDKAIAEATEEIERIAVALELPDGVGLVRTENDLKVARDKRLQLIERREARSLALNETRKRLAEAQTFDAEVDATERWEAQAKLAPAYKAKLADAVAHLRKANVAIVEALAIRERAAKECPDLELRFGGYAFNREVEGLDRMVHIRDLAVDFHPRFRADPVGGTIDDVIGSEHAAIELLTTRHLKVEPAPPPPKPPERVQGPMARIGRVA